MASSNEMTNRVKNFIDGHYSLLRKRQYKIREYKYFKNLLKSTKTKNILNKVIVINAVRQHINTFDSEVFFGIVFAVNGAKVKILLDDGVLMHTEDYFFDSLPTYKKKIDSYSLNPYFPYYRNYKSFINTVVDRNLYKKALKVYQHENLDFVYYSDIIDINNLNYENLEELKDDAEASTVRFFKSTELNYNDKYVKYYYYISLKNALLCRNLGEYVLNKIKPDYFITSHAIYSTFRPAYEFLKKNGIKCRVYGGAKLYTRDFRDIYLSDTKAQTLSISKYWKAFEKAPVTKDMENKVIEFFNDRLSVSTADMQYLEYMKKGNLFKVKKNDGYKYQVGLFPNVIWDGNIKERHVAFEGIMDWLLSTIEFVKNRKDIKLYIKAHPGENFFCKKSDKIVDLIKRHVNLDDYKNLVLIPPELKVNTYEFLKSGIDLGITYDGFLALEMPLLKIPAIVCVKEGYSSIEGGNFPVSNKKEYFNYLNNIDKLLKEFHDNYDKYFKNIVRYAYWYIFESNIKLPTLSFKENIKQLVFDLCSLTQKDLLLEKAIMDVFNQY